VELVLAAFYNRELMISQWGTCYET